MTAAERANITAHLYEDEALNPVACHFAATVRLWAALNNEPARPIAVGQPRLTVQGGRRFTVWDFNDIDVAAARDPRHKIHFFVTVDGFETRRNIWTHGADARTLAPVQDIPTAVLTTMPSALDARIEIVWPHGGQPVTEARLANITVYLFRQGTLEALGPSVRPLPTVRLHRSLNNEPDGGRMATRVGVPRTITAQGQTWLAWDFNDVDVAAANDPQNRLYFWVTTDEMPTATNIWTHGVLGLTRAPIQDVPARSCR